MEIKNMNEYNPDVLLVGYEQIVLAHELGKSEVCFQRINKMNR